MAENLKTTKFPDGTDIPLVTDNTAWSELKTPGYCLYDAFGGTYKATYGALYNWFAISTGKLCPSGWHVPTETEWHKMILTLDPDATLQSYVPGIPASSQGPFIESSIAGDKLKETGTTHWRSPDIGATNESGFTALPGGIRFSEGWLSNFGEYVYWWSAPGSWIRFLGFDISKIYRHDRFSLQYGISVRCIKDN
jgi:uncharacterized protein (TIGR02145 family)